MKWTTQQQNAISLPVSNMIVSAAAGSGKTAVMAERIIQRLTGDDFVEIDKILVVTYTSAAASEIKERIMKNIMDKLDEGENAKLSSQLIKLPYAHISTIHSFCLDLIKKYFYILGIDPNIKIADESDIIQLKKKAIDKVMDSHYDADDKVFRKLVSDYSSKRDTSVADTVISIYDFSRTMPDTDFWLDSLPVPYGNEPTHCTRYLMQCAVMACELAAMYYKQALEICGDDTECLTIKNTIINEYTVLLTAMENTEYEKMKSILESIDFVNWSRVTGPADVKKKVLSLRNEAKGIIKDKILKKFLVLSITDIKTDNAKVVDYIYKYAELVREFSKAFDELKKEKNLIDFSDFEHLALKLLRNPDGTPSEIAQAVSEEFEEIYIDEYQDCNNIQNTIFNCISGHNRGKPNIFCVGDMKQSIYSFRDSNPLLFKEKSDNYTLYNGEDISTENKIILSSNFRSRKSVLDFVNSLFTQIMSTECGDLDYNEEERLNYGGGYIDVNKDTDFVDIDIIDESNTFGDSYGPAGNDRLSSIEAEAVHVGKKIKKYISDGYMLYDKKNQLERPIKYKDIVILLRSTKVPAPIFEKILSDMGIPVYSDKGTAYFDTEEIVFLLSFLKIIDNPDDDISLVAVMKSPIFGFDENKLLRIRLSGPDISFYKCIKLYKEKNTDELSDKISTFLELLEKYYNKSRYMDTDEFLCYLLRDIDYYTYLSIFPDSKLKKTNVRYFLKRAKEFEKSNFKGIYSFVRFIENYKQKNDAESAKILSENDNVVRIMSIHKSKGLEFPLVFVSCLGRNFNSENQRQKVVMHRDFGVGTECVYRDASIRIPTANMIAIKRKLSFESASEELRVLYVALTRATEKLVLTATVSKGAELISGAESEMAIMTNKINPYLIYSATNFIKIILYGIVRSEGFPRDFSSPVSNIIKDGCKYNMSLINISDISFGPVLSKKEVWSDAFENVTDNYEKVSKILSFKYSHSESFAIPSNMSVTELKKMTIESEDIYNPFDDVSLVKPTKFGKQVALKGAALGTLIHSVMEKINFDAVNSLQDIEKCIADMHDLHLISDDDVTALSVEQIWNFFTSPLGVRMKSHSHTLQREFSFKYLADVKDIFGFSDDEPIIVQGTIDAFFEDDDGSLVVVDYKTDRVIDGNSAVIVQRYRSQLEYYAKALELTFHKKVKEKILYLFDTNESINV